MNTVTNESANESAAVNPQDILDAVRSKVCERTAGGEVVERVIEALVEYKLVRRTELLKGGIERLREIHKDIENIKPYDKGFTKDGETIDGEVYTEHQARKLKELNEELELLITVVAKQDFDKLSELGY